MTALQLPRYVLQPHVRLTDTGDARDTPPPRLRGPPVDRRQGPQRLGVQKAVGGARQVADGVHPGCLRGTAEGLLDLLDGARPVGHHVRRGRLLAGCGQHDRVAHARHRERGALQFRRADGGTGVRVRAGGPSGGQRADPDAGVGAHGFQQRAQGPGELLGGVRLVQVGRVLDVQVEAVGVVAGAVPLQHVDEQVELGGAGRRGAQRHPVLAQPEHGPLVVLKRQHHLEQRMPCRVARRVEFLHQPVEGQVLVVQRLDVERPHPRQQVTERGVAGGVGAQHHRVGEQTDHVVQDGLGPAGDRGADHHVLTPRPSG